MMTRKLQQQARRIVILEVAGKQFLTHGYGATTMSAIAAAMGGSKETLWRYFPSKEELLAAYIDHATAAFRDRLALNLDSRAPLTEALRNFAQHYIQEICSPDSISLHRLAISESARFPEVGQLFYERAPQATERLLADFLASHMRLGNLRLGDAARAASTLTQLCMTARYPILFGIHTAADIDALDLAETASAEFLRLYDSGQRS